MKNKTKFDPVQLQAAKDGRIAYESGQPRAIPSEAYNGNPEAQNMWFRGYDIAKYLDEQEVLTPVVQ